MRELTKAEACRELGVSLPTLDRRITSGEIQVRRVSHGRRHRVYVMIDDDRLTENAVNPRSLGTPPEADQEQIRSLEEQISLIQAQFSKTKQVVLFLGLAVAGLFGMLVAGISVLLLVMT